MKNLLILSLVFFLSGCFESEPQVLFDKVVKIDDWGVKYWSFTTGNTMATLELVEADPYPVDIFIIGEESFEKFISGRDFNYIIPFSSVGNYKDSMTGKLKKGKYAVAMMYRGEFKLFGSNPPSKAHIRLTLH